MFWGGLIRIFLLHHITWSVNSVCHFVGSRRFRVKDESRNVWWLSWISFGESWHHNHHAFPSSAFHGLKPWELDIGGLVIRLLRRLGLVWKVNVPTAEMQQRRRELAAE
jgi:stearoyl-CoA desaturase (delta-9 desaturase)